MSDARRSTALRIATALLTVAAVTAVVWAIVSDDEALHTLGAVSATALAALVVIQAVALGIQAYRHKLTVDAAAGVNVPAAGWFKLFVVGRFLNTLFPQAGNAYKGMRLKEDYGIPFTKYLSGFVAFTWLSTLLSLVVAAILILALEPDQNLGGTSAALVVVLLLGATALGPPALHWVIRRLRIEGGFFGWAHRRTEDMLGGAVGMVRSGSVMARFAVAGLADLAVGAVGFAVAFGALEIDASVGTIVLFYILQQLGVYVNVTPGNLGVLELLSGALAAQVGIGLTGGLLVATLIRVSRYLALLIVGASVGGLGAARRARALPSSDRAQNQEV